jgi:hypothetical protein
VDFLLAGPGLKNLHEESGSVDGSDWDQEVDHTPFFKFDNFLTSRRQFRRITLKQCINATVEKRFDIV